MNARSFLSFAAMFLAILFNGCGDDTGPYVELNGGGFVVNYSGGLSEAYYGFGAKPLRALPAGLVLEAEFENPAGGKPFIDSQIVTGPLLKYGFRSPYLKGIVANHPYKATLRVMKPGTREVIETYTQSFQSKFDDAWLAK